MTKAATLQQALTRFLDPSGLDRQRQRVCTHLLACRTKAMGGMVLLSYADQLVATER